MKRLTYKSSQKEKHLLEGLNLLECMKHLRFTTEQKPIHFVNGLEQITKLEAISIGFTKLG